MSTLQNPIEWFANRHNKRLRGIEDEAIRHHKIIEDLNIGFNRDVNKAYSFLVSIGIIKAGDPAPWQNMSWDEAADKLLEEHRELWEKLSQS